MPVATTAQYHPLVGSKVAGSCVQNILHLSNVTRLSA